MKAIIIDDDARAISALTERLNAYDNINIEGLLLVNDTNPDVVFLDVEMPEMSGIELLDEIYKSSSDCDVVMCTAFDSYMLRSFRNNAFDFLLKPVDPKELDVVMKRLEQSRKKKIKKTRREHESRANS